MWPNILEGLGAVLQLNNILIFIIATFIGVIIGILPGLGPTFALALFLPFTFYMNSASAMIFLVVLYCSTVYGGSITSILLNVPGTVGSVATCFDGYPMAKQGKGGVALVAMTIGSSIAGLIGVAGLVTLAPLLVNVSLLLGPSEYFMLALMGISLVAVASKGDTIRGLVMGGLGLLLSFIGRDVVSGFLRFDFGLRSLQSGISFIPVSIGLFAISQAIILAEEGSSVAQTAIETKNEYLSGLKTAIKNWVTIVRSSVIGLIIGIMPGIGISISNFLAYLIEKRVSKDTDSFGKGNIRGVLAPESANKATVAGELIPAFSLGIPGGSTSAIFLVGMTIHGLRPGADLYSTNATIMSLIYWAFIIGQLSYLVIGLLFSKPLAKITKISNTILVPIILILSFLGAFSYQNSITDVFIAIVFGILGYIMHKRKYPVACLIIGMVLGPIMESNFQRALLLSDGSYLTFLNRPLSIVFFLITLASLIVPPIVEKARKSPATTEKVR
jgi:putative tricarboxylic transport membrane protein